ncbi:MAG TPA: sodium:solute symporter [Oscillatoriales cyanobacterium M59_W2019_021]|nr:sodium:solute symporter [Oscillatoriales cyanobacterium M4454_W2019_049]HIK50313.1 sodium:solute symporter [Oscillatoriales cyanobacterium M59_W2019_021]
MHWIDYCIVVIYLVAIVAYGIYLERHASEGIDAYFLGNRNLPWWVLGSSGMASNIDLSGTMIISALIYALGTKGFFIEIRGGIVLIMPFLMTFMGKWNRRATVMTMAEWMHFRFGNGKEGDIARIVSAVASLIFAISSISYFAVGGGKFFGNLISIDDKIASISLISLATVYTVASGFYGVVWTDFFQGLLILVAILYICFLSMQIVDIPETFSVSISGTEQLQTWNFSEWSRILPPLQVELPGNYAIFNFFGAVIFFYLLKTVMEGCSGTGGYMVQRYFAAKNEREVGLLSLFWIFLLSFRWPMVTGLALLGIHYGATKQVITDPELILPTTIAEYVPLGMKGLLVACFVAAAMSTFTSIINSSAAYWVKDIYQAYLRPQASNEQLIFQSRLASVAIVVLGLLLSFNITNVNDIWGWLTLGLGAGLAVPLLLRWYWWRFNGYGFAIGTLAGTIAAILSKAIILPAINNPQIQEYILFLVPSLSSLLGCILGTMFTAPTDRSTLENFYNVTRPFGFWGIISRDLPGNVRAKIWRENRRDIQATAIAVPWQLVMFLMGMMFVMKQWDKFGVLFLIFLLLSIALYFVWFRHLER